MCFPLAFSLLLTIINLILVPVFLKLRALIPPEKSPVMMIERAFHILNNNNRKLKCIVILAPQQESATHFLLAVIFTQKFCVEKGGERTQQGKCLQAPGCGK